MIEKLKIFENIKKFPHLVEKGYKINSFFINYSNNIFTYGGFYIMNNEPVVLISIEDIKKKKKKIDETVKKFDYSKNTIYLNLKSNFDFLNQRFLQQNINSYSLITKKKIISVYPINIAKKAYLDLLISIKDLNEEFYIYFYDFINYFPLEIRQFLLRSMYISFDIYNDGGRTQRIINVQGDYLNNNETINVRTNFGCKCRKCSLFPKEIVNRIMFPRDIILDQMIKKEINNIKIYYNGEELLFFDEKKEYIAFVTYKKDGEFVKNETLQETFAKKFKEILEFSNL